MSSEGDGPRLVSLKQAALLLGCCRQTLYRMHADNQIVFRKLRGRTMVPMSEVRRIENGEPMPGTAEVAVEEPPKRRPKKVKLSPRESVGPGRDESRS